MTELELLTREWGAARLFLLSLAFLGIVVASILGIYGYFIAPDPVDRLVLMWGAMGFLVISTLGVNLVSRIDIRREGPYFWFMALLSLTVLGILYIYSRVEGWGLGTTWPLLVSVAFASTMGGAMLRMYRVKKAIARLMESVGPSPRP